VREGASVVRSQCCKQLLVDRRKVLQMVGLPVGKVARKVMMAGKSSEQEKGSSEEGQ